eukprot:246872_1
MNNITIEKSTKNKRTIKNSLVNIDDNIPIEPGPSFINWNPLVKIKLKEREIELMKIRLKIIEETIISSISQFTSENSIVFNKPRNPPVHIHVNRMQKDNYNAYYNLINNTKYTIINAFNKSVTAPLTSWKGYKPN